MPLEDGQGSRHPQLSQCAALPEVAPVQRKLDHLVKWLNGREELWESKIQQSYNSVQGQVLHHRFYVFVTNDSYNFNTI